MQNVLDEKEGWIYDKYLIWSLNLLIGILLISNISWLFSLIAKGEDFMSSIIAMDFTRRFLLDLATLSYLAFAFFKVFGLIILRTAIKSTGNYRSVFYLFVVGGIFWFVGYCSTYWALYLLE